MSDQVHSLSWFERFRNAQYKFCLKDIITPISKGKKHITVKAPVKCGKRSMVEICHLYTSEKDILLKQKTYFVSAFHRKADEKQRKELSDYGIDVKSITNKKKSVELIKNLEKDLKIYDEIHIHLDELDFGSSNKQLLSKIYKKYYNNDKIIWIKYSATTEEDEEEFLDDLVSREGHFAEFIPDKEYYGMKRYFDDSRFRPAQEFFKYINEEEICITPHGQELIANLLKETKDKNNRRNTAVLRLTGKVPSPDSKKKYTTLFEYVKGFKKDLEEEINKDSRIRFRMIFVSSNDKDETLDWSDDSYWEDKHPNIAHLYIVCEVAKRSTEWRCHPYLVWYHTYRNSWIINTTMQDQERPVYYENSFLNIGIKFEDIKCNIYGNLPIAKYSAGLISMKTLMEANNGLCKMSGNLKVRNTNKRNIKAKIHTYNSWEEIPGNFRTISYEQFIQQNPKFEKNITYTIKRKKDGKFQIIGTNWTIPDKVLKKFDYLRGKRMTHIRGNISNWILNVCMKNKISKPPVCDFKILNRNRAWGVDEKQIVRRNIYYDDLNDNPRSFKIAVRLCESQDNEINTKVLNKSMYSNVRR